MRWILKLHNIFFLFAEFYKQANLYLSAMKINAILQYLESMAHRSLQESYDNAGLITGQQDWECTGVLCTLDVTEEVVLEATHKKVNLIVAHHPIIFKGLKKINGHNYVEKTIIAAIKNDIAIYAIHTNLDNIINGVNGKIATLLGLTETEILAPQSGKLKKLFTFAPVKEADAIRQALFDAGAGHICHYSECSFNTEGTGTFKGGENTAPFVGKPGVLHREQEMKIEVIFPAFLQEKILKALRQVHPYEEVAYDIVELANHHPAIGAGIVGQIPKAMDELAFLQKLKENFGTPVIKHTKLTGRKIQRVAICGGAGSFLISNALAAGAEAFITADVKYHEFFDANDKILFIDVGHFESEQFTIDLLQEVLEQKFPNFAVLKTEVRTNPVFYY